MTVRLQNIRTGIYGKYDNAADKCFVIDILSINIDLAPVLCLALQAAGENEADSHALEDHAD